MIINKNSWHYKAWKWTYDRSWQVPEYTNFCSYMRRIMFLVPIKSLTRSVVFTIYMLCLAIIAGIRWVFGYKTVSTDLDDSPVEYSGLPVAGREIYPWHVLLLAIILGFEVLLKHDISWSAFGIIHAILLAIALIANLGAWFFSDDSTEIFRDWVLTQKRKICPLIEFGDHYDSQLSTEDYEESKEESEPDTVEDLIGHTGSGSDEIKTPAHDETNANNIK